MTKPDHDLSPTLGGTGFVSAQDELRSMGRLNVVKTSLFGQGTSAPATLKWLNDDMALRLQVRSPGLLEDIREAIAATILEHEKAFRARYGNEQPPSLPVVDPVLGMSLGQFEELRHMLQAGLITVPESRQMAQRGALLAIIDEEAFRGMDPGREEAPP